MSKKEKGSEKKGESDEVKSKKRVKTNKQTNYSK